MPYSQQCVVRSKVMTDLPPQRVVIRGVEPEIECGRFPVKRVIGESVVVEADVFTDGHDLVAAAVRYRHEDDEAWSEVSMDALGNDRWRGEFPIENLGQYIYTVSGWIDPFKTWYTDFQKRVAAGQDVSIDLQIGKELLAMAAERASGDDARKLQHAADRLHQAEVTDRLASLASSYPDLTNASHYKELRVTVDPIKARFSTWYEMF